MSHNFENLRDHILPLSVATNFQEARYEWKLQSVVINDELDTCPCGKTGIRDLCYIENNKNGKVTYVGNVCVNKFLGLDTATLVTGLKRIIGDNTANPNEAVIEYAYERGYIYEKERQFLLDTRRKRNLSDKQLQWKIKINRRIVEKIIVKRQS